MSRKFLILYNTCHCIRGLLGLTHTSVGSTNGHYDRVVGGLASTVSELARVARGSAPSKSSAIGSWILLMYWISCPCYRCVDHCRVCETSNKYITQAELAKLVNLVISLVLNIS